MKLAKRIHFMTHENPQQATRICEDAGWITPELSDEIRKESDHYRSCAIYGAPGPSKNICVNNVNEDFIVGIQVD